MSSIRTTPDTTTDEVRLKPDTTCETYENQTDENETYENWPDEAVGE